MKFIFFVCATLYCTILLAQPTLTKLSSEDYRPFKQESYQIVNNIAKLQGKYYYVTFQEVEQTKKEKKKNKSQLIPKDKIFRLYETDGSATGTKIAVQNNDGFYQLGATKDALLYHTYTDTYGTLYKYMPTSGAQSLNMSYKLNAISKVTRIFTYPNRSDAVLTHFQNNTYFLTYINKDGRLDEINKIDYVEPSKLTYLPFQIWSKPLLNDTAIYTIGSKKLKKGFTNTFIAYDLAAKKSFFYLCPPDTEDNNIAFQGTPFLFKNNPSLFYLFNDSAKKRNDIGIMSSTGNKNFSNAAFKDDYTFTKSYNYIEEKDNQIVLMLDDYIGIFFKSSSKLLKLNSGINNTEFFNNTERTLIAGDYIYYTNGDSIIYQKFKNFETGKQSDLKLYSFFAKRKTDFPAQSIEGMVKFRGAATNKYLYYITEDNTLMRFSGNVGENKPQPVALPSGTKLKQWLMFLSCDDAVFVGGITQEAKGKESYEVFVLKDGN